MELGRERVRQCRPSSRPEQRLILQRGRGFPTPPRPVADQQQALVLDPWLPPGRRRAVAARRHRPERDVRIPAARSLVAPDRRCNGRHRRGSGRRGRVAVGNGALHEPVEQPRRLAARDMILCLILCLRRGNVGQRKIGAAFGQGSLGTLNVTGFAERPQPREAAECWKMRMPERVGRWSRRGRALGRRSCRPAGA